jgi:hypothetical protein
MDAELNKPKLVSDVNIFPSQGDFKMHCVKAQNFHCSNKHTDLVISFLFTNIWTYGEQAKRRQRNAMQHITTLALSMP